MELNESLGYLLSISAKLIKRNLDLLLKDCNLTSFQWTVLKLLNHELRRYKKERDRQP